MHVLATVGHKVSEKRKYGILLAAEEVVRAGVLSYAPGSESVTRFTCLTFHRLVSFCRFVFGCWGGFVCFAVAFFLITDQSVRSSYQPMTSSAYIHDCHSCYDERSTDPKKKAVMPTCPTIGVSRRKGDFSCHVCPNWRGRTSHFPSIYPHSAGCIYEGTEEEKAGRGQCLGWVVNAAWAPCCVHWCMTRLLVA